MAAIPLLGRWEKISNSTCSRMYPEVLEFHANGIYFAHSEEGEFTIWDSGSFEILQEDQVRISTANDALVQYTFEISGDTLSFTDPNGCDFQYKKN